MESDDVGRRRTGWVLVGVQFGLLIALVLAPHRDFAMGSRMIVGLVLLFGGLALGTASVGRLGRALTPNPVPLEGATLRIAGPYRWVRHPIYVAVILGATGWTFAVGSWWTVGVLVVLIVFFILKSRWEDRLLAEQYGQRWQDWAATTGAFVPRPIRH